MRFRLVPRSMTLDDLELYNFEFSENFSGFRRFRTQQQPTAKRMNIDQDCQRQRCKHVELSAGLSCFVYYCLCICAFGCLRCLIFSL